MASDTNRSLIDPHEIQNLSALVEASKTADDSIGKLFNEAVRDPAIIFGHISGCGQSGLNCNCTFARINLNEFTQLSALNGAAQPGLDGLGTNLTQSQQCKPKNRILSNIFFFFGMLKETRFRGQTEGRGLLQNP